MRSEDRPARSSQPAPLAGSALLVGPPAALLPLLLLLALVLALAGCDSGGGDGCGEGGEGCACSEEGGCDEGLVCDHGTCRETCTPGNEDCACINGSLCNLGLDGRQLACGTEGVCVAPACPAGELGCDCAEGGTCSGALVCSTESGIERCEIDGCTIGELDCGCTLDRKCIGSTCQAGMCTALECATGEAGCACSSAYTCKSSTTRCDLESETCTAGGDCTAGNLGCTCNEDESCVTGLVCTAGACQSPSCPAGTEGCGCLDGACGSTASGELLSCTAGICESASCPSGAAGCVCRNGLECDGDGALCVDGYCKGADCIPGSAGCDCLAGSCNPGLTCQSGAVCVDNTGRTGGACKADGTCERNNRCDKSASPAVCQWCDLGTQGCQCLDGEDENGLLCNAGLTCLEGLCVGDETVFAREVPDEVICYTPCTDDFTDESGVEHDCDADGQMEGCLEDKVCDRGSCVDPDDVADICYKDGDCADFQLCIQGYCYAECASDEACGAGEDCYQKVCRQTCSLSTQSCPSGHLCEASDADNGYCMPSATSGSTPQQATEGSFSVNVDVIRMSNVATEQLVELTNHSDEYLTFTLSKSEHYLVYRDGTPETLRTSSQAEACSGAECPMWWLEMGEFGSITTANEIEVRAAPHCDDDDTCPVVVVRLPAGGGVDAARWSGTIRIESTVGTQSINVSYVERPEGQWGGKIIYFANFDDTGIDSAGTSRGWLARNRDYVTGEPNVTYDLKVNNGLLQRWGAFRNGNLTGGWDEFLAVLNATETELWRFPTVQEDCPVSQGACYLYVDSSGSDTGALPREYVTSLAGAPIPTGATEFPFAMNLYVPDSTQPQRLSGRVVSELALHYAGDPAIELVFEGDPSNTANCDPDVSSNCVNFLKTAKNATSEDGLELEAIVGGRYALPATGGSCASGFTKVDVPWLVPGFLGNAWQDEATGLYRRSWCIDFRLPAYDTPIASIPADVQIDNLSLARSNPVPDGQVLTRQLELLDGAMIDQRVMLIFFRERYPSFLGGEDLVAYGYMMLERNQEQLERADADGNGVPDAYDGNSPPSSLGAGTQTDAIACSDDILDEILGAGVALTSSNAATVVENLIAGGQSSTPLTTPAAASDGSCVSSSAEEVHYVCESTGLFNGGSDNTTCWGAGARGPNDDSCLYAQDGTCDDGGVQSASSRCGLGTDVTDCGSRYSDPRVACPETSRVVFFTASASLHDFIVGHACQDTATCMDTLMTWVDNGSVVSQLEPTWTCTNGAFSCDSDTRDRRSGKVFYQAGDAQAHFNALRPELADAFRYKTQFVNRSGTTLGFTPQVCIPFSTSTPYCYDPDKIEQVRERVDCLLSIYETYYASPSGPQNATLFAYLEENFAVREEFSALGGAPTRYDGFERLYAELLIMLGDDAYTSAFESRFDLAGINAAGFEGDLFEVDGIAVSGIAGFEIYKLHQAVQYYDLSLDRFYQMSSVIAAALDSGSPSSARNFLSSETVTSYFDRLIRASTQRSRAWAEIARRYQGFNRADLARRVAERAYTQTYLESVALANVILQLYEIAGGSQRDQLLVELESAQRRYRMALLDLKTVYEGITDETTLFGYAPDYIPFPALSNSAGVDTNAFDTVLQVSLSKLDVAKQREQIALEKTRAFDTDEASFQAELTRISRTYENQLAEICGFFTAPNGNVYPAIERYAYLDPELEVFGDPCGFAGNGQIHNVLTQLNIDRVEVQRVLTAMDNVNSRVTIEKTRAELTCAKKIEIADYQYSVADELRSLDQDIGRVETWQQQAQRGFQMVDTIINLANCASTECTTVGTAITATIINAAAEVATIEYFRGEILDLQEEKAELEADTARWVTLQDCAFATIDLNASMATILLDLRDQELSLLNARYRLALDLSELSKLRQQAKRIQLEMEEAVELSINVEVAKNDPNIRIYRNDAVINAEVAFEDALREAYRLTLVYQYYTSQSYAPLEQLFLTRMVSNGDYNLENYVYELRNAFTAFTEEFGNPDVRVMLVSLRDDILQIPRLDDNGDPLGLDARATLMREKLADPRYLNSQGYLALPFSTRLDALSPLTRNHKVLYMEANIEGNDNGDYLGRVYLRQVGTSTIHSVEDDLQYYRFPERTAVINPFFNSTREFASSPEVYRSYRLRDRPLVNNHWELVINQRDEVVNQDINLEALTDIKLFVFYTDFTQY